MEALMPNVEIYTTAFCPFCSRAKSLLDRKGVAYTEHDVMMNGSLRKKMTDMAGSRSVPQVFVDGEHIGDCDEIHALDAKGALDNLLGLGD
jgi:glutaredoxin 3